MTTKQLKNTPVSLAQGVVNTFWPYVSGRRGLIILVIGLAAGGMAMNWGWLVAAGLAPILLALLPCAVMCGLGLCMNKAGGKSCSSNNKTTADESSLKGGPDESA